MRKGSKAVLGADMEGLLCMKIAEISMREVESIIVTQKYYIEDVVRVDVEGSRGYSGTLEFTDKGKWEEV